MKINNQNYKFICPQITFLFYLFIYIGLFIYFIINDEITLSIIIILPILVYIFILYHVNDGIKHKNFENFMIGLKLSFFFSVNFTLSKVILFIILFIQFSSLSFDLHRSVILKKNSLKSEILIIKSI